MAEEFLFAIEIGGTKLQLFVGEASGRIHYRRRFDIDPGQGGQGIQNQIQTALEELLPKWNIAAAGVGFGGPVDWKTGRIYCSHQVQGWADFELGHWLSQLTGKPVTVENDANTATLGEALRGAGRGFHRVFYMTLGSGVGGGMVCDGVIYHGAKPGEAEIGHLLLDRSGTILESRCSGWAVDRKIRALIQRGAETVLRQLAGSSAGAEAKHLVEALNQKDHEAEGILNETAEDIAFGLSHVVHLFHPEIVILGGGLSLIGEPLRHQVAESLSRFVMKAFAPGPQVALAALGEDAVPVGALILAARLHSRGSEPKTGS